MEAAAAKEFKSSSNYYFENHICKDGNNKKIRMDNELSNDITDEILRFGVCRGCGVCFYHKDHK